MFDQPIQQIDNIDWWSADGFRSFYRPATNKHTQSCEQYVLGSCKQAIAPINRGADGLLACREIASTTSQRVEARRTQPIEQLLGWKQPNTGCGQLNRQWQAIQAHADRGDGGRIRVGEPEIGPHRTGTAHEQRNRIILAEIHVECLNV